MFQQPEPPLRTNHNKAACALANKLARIAYACLRDHAPFGQPTRITKKIDRQSFSSPDVFRPSGRLSNYPFKQVNSPPSLATRLIAHHGTQGHPHTD